MSQSDTKPEFSLPMVIAAQLERPSFQRFGASADFVSQLIAARDRLASQRARRRAPVDVALCAYDEGGARGVKRLPSGSYRSRIV